jgi:hypothetical protein
MATLQCRFSQHLVDRPHCALLLQAANLRADAHQSRIGRDAEHATTVSCDACSKAIAAAMATPVLTGFTTAYSPH